MTNLDNISMVFTIISILVTVVSILTSISSFKSARKAKQYKEDVLNFREKLYLEGFLSKFETESKYFINATRKVDWYKGIDENTVISPFAEVLSSFGKIYPMIENYGSLREKVHYLNEIINNFEFITDQRRKVINLIMEITDILEIETHRNRQKMIK